MSEAPSVVTIRKPVSSVGKKPFTISLPSESMAGGGVQLNYVPRDGGNTYKGLFFITGATTSTNADLTMREPFTLVLAKPRMLPARFSGSGRTSMASRRSSIPPAKPTVPASAHACACKRQASQWPHGAGVADAGSGERRRDKPGILQHRGMVGPQHVGILRYIGKNGPRSVESAS